MFKYSDIRVVHLEISSRCNAACPDCPRNLRGVDIEHLGDFVVRDMSLEEVQKVFPVEFIRQLRTLLINGNHGDFITCRDALKIVQYFSNSNPDLKIDISTNASGQPAIWEPLARIPNVRVMFRIDGLEDTHHLYRQYTDFNLIMRNADKFIKAGGMALWYMIKFDFNEHQLELAEQRATAMGFTEFKIIDVGRNNTHVYDRQGNYSHTIGTPTHHKDFKQLLDARVSMLPLAKEIMVEFYAKVPAKQIKCKVQKPAEIYVQSNGQVYPCCWIGRAPDTNIPPPGNDQTRAIAKNNNALEQGIEKSIEWFAELERSWTIDTVSNGRNCICNETCGR